MTRKRVLIVDDDDGVRDIIQFSLEAAAGWQVLTAASGKEGLAMAQAERPDAILLDVMMPGLDGPATFERLKTDPATQGIPTIFLTAKARASERKQLIDLGVAGTISKPFEAQTLVRQMKAILDWGD